MISRILKLIGVHKKTALLKINNNSCDKLIARQMGGNYCQD